MPKKINLSRKQQTQLRTLLKQGLPRNGLLSIIDSLHQAGARVLLVGGAVRDLLMSRPCKDLDFEVYGLKIDQLERILKKLTPTSLVGKSFGVLKIHGAGIDFSVPRADSIGRKPTVQLDPLMDFKQAFARRDLTINAMGVDVRTGELIDPFDGLRDLEARRLRAPDVTRFAQDPLRLYRVMQFVARFAMQPDRELNALCARMPLGVSRERVEQEFAKMFLQAAQPSLGIVWLRTIGRLSEIMPELAATIGVAQDVRWHPEGDVFEHTMQTLDAVARMKFDSDKEKLMACWAALGHDLGKVSSSQLHEEGRVSAHGHELAGVPLTKKLMRRITRDRDLIAGACAIVRYHMLPGQFVAHKSKPAAYKRLALKLAPHVSMALLGTFARADKLARNPARGTPLKTGDAFEKRFLANARKLAVLAAAEKPLLLGRDLLDVVPAGPQLGVLLKKAYALQLDKGITDKAELKKRVLKRKSTQDD